MNGVSSESRKYELKARAERQRETRDRIARAAAELHEEKGVAQTTVAEIARRAGVTRLTVYNHFADLGALLPACAAHYTALHPVPELDDQGRASADAGEVLRTGLERIYGWYRETEPMFGRLFGDRAAVPELDAFMAQDIDRLQAQWAERLAAGYRARGRRAERIDGLVRLAVDFWTWRRLRDEGFDEAAAAALMATAVAGV